MTRIRPAGRSPGTFAPIGAWIVGLAIARLTGAAAVVLLLVASLVGLAAIACAGWWRLRSVRVVGVVAPTVGTVDEPISVAVDHVDPSSSRAPVWIEIDGNRAQMETTSPTMLTITPDRPGIVRTLTVTVLSAAAPGLIWWRRRQRFDLDPIHVAPRATGPLLSIQRVTSSAVGTSVHGVGARTGDVDGSRPWRPGESEQAIHWPSTLRAGEVIAHDRTTESDALWRVDLDSEPARLRFTIEEGLRRGHGVTLDDGPSDAGRSDSTAGHADIAVHTIDDARHWSAVAADRRPPVTPTPDDRGRWWHRQVSLGPRLETRLKVNSRSRLATAGAALISLWMLLGALEAGPMLRLAAVAGVAVATAISLRFEPGTRPLWIRALIVVVALSALARIAVQNAGVGGLLEALRGPMPDLLMLLVVLHGAEIADRRTNRVHLAITGVVTAYAAGLRIDGAVGWWMIAWAVAAIIAVSATEPRPETMSRSARPTAASAGARVAAWSIAGLVATLALASLVPVPDGPASLGLPALSNDADTIDDAGSLVGPDGTPSSPTSGSSTRGALGQAGGYPGFSNTLDTSVRGDLGDEVVMRVRAPEPAFWRGQTFSDFDGRVWTVSEDALDATAEGPRIPVAPTIGDPVPGVTPTEEFVQTFHVEADLPNVVFAASRADTIIFDGSVTARSDGALRADRTLSKGTVYSVVSQRVEVTGDVLRAQGDLGRRFAPFTDHPEVAPFLALPESTSEETVRLANELRTDGSTYDTILAYQRWIGQNTVYDLDAPVPDGDAVDDFLFGSQRGFCEQIASSLVVMLRSQGVPARLATGYVPGERDRVSGVFAVKASGAHAWVEVWFPETGWEAFDPTASVPLAGDAARSTVGADAFGAVVDTLLSRPVHVGAVVAGGFAALTLARILAEIRRRRARGAWGILSDRFMALAPEARTAPQAARSIVERLGPDARHAEDVARRLDRVAFDPAYQPSADERSEVSRSIATLERAARRGSRKQSEPVGATST